LPEIAPLDTARFYLRRRCPFSVPARSQGARRRLL